MESKEYFEKVMQDYIYVQSVKIIYTKIKNFL